MNAYWMLTDLRDNVSEASAKHWGDDDLLRKLNFSHRIRAMELMGEMGDWLVVSEDLTPSSSVITLPRECAKPVYMEHKADEYEIPIISSVRERRLRRTSTGVSGFFGGADLNAYLEKGTIVVNEEGFGDQVTLWYQKRVPDLHAGVAANCAASTLGFALANEPQFIADYYKGAYVEVIDSTSGAIDIRSEITVFTAVNAIATITGTPTNGDYYGTVSELPEEGMILVVLDATLLALAKPGASLDTKYFEYFMTLQRNALKSWNAWISSRFVGSNRIRVTERD